MPTTFTPVSRTDLETFLAEKGFAPITVGSELVYQFRHLKRPELVVKVWTTLPARGGDVRDSGQDAMRVTLAWEGDTAWSPWRKEPKRSFGIFSAKRIFRVGGTKKILDRLYERMREAYARGNEFLREHWKDLPPAPTSTSTRKVTP